MRNRSGLTDTSSQRLLRLLLHGREISTHWKRWLRDARTGASAGREVWIGSTSERSRRSYHWPRGAHADSGPARRGPQAGLRWRYREFVTLYGPKGSARSCFKGAQPRSGLLLPNRCDVPYCGHSTFSSHPDESPRRGGPRAPRASTWRSTVTTLQTAATTSATGSAGRHHRGPASRAVLDHSGRIRRMADHQRSQRGA